MRNIELVSGVHKLEFAEEAEAFYYDDASCGAALEMVSSLVRGGEGRALLLYGPTGSGKSRLVCGLLREAGLLQDGEGGNVRSADEWAAGLAKLGSRWGLPEMLETLSPLPVLVFENMQLLRGKSMSQRMLTETVAERMRKGTGVLLVSEELFPGLTEMLAQLRETGLAADPVPVSFPGKACRRAYAEDCSRLLRLNLGPEELDRLAEERETIYSLRSALLALSLDRSLKEEGRRGGPAAGRQRG